MDNCVVTEIKDIEIFESDIEKAEQCLIDNGIEKDEAQTVLQALGYILLDVDFYDEIESMV